MPNIFDGIRKMSDEDVRLEIALITQTNLLNAAKETGSAPIPEKGKPGQFMQDAQGNVVISKLDEQTLQDIAKAGEGLYIRASNTEVGLNRLLDEVNRMEKSLLEERVYSDYAEKYQYFLLVGLFFIFVEFMILGRKNKHFMKINLFKR